MMDRRLFSIATIVAVSSLTVAAGSFMGGENSNSSLPSSEVLATEVSQDPDGKQKQDEPMDCGSPAKNTTASKLPNGIKPLKPAKNAEFRGGILCGKCVWKTGEFCNVVLWDKKEGRVAIVLPNKQLYDLEKFIGT